MKVSEIMVTEVKSCRPETDLATATGILWSSTCGALPVVDSEGAVVGIVTDRDICVALGTRNQVASDIRVSEVKPDLQEIYTCAPEDDVHAALQTMRNHGVRRLPVVSDQSLRGILCLDEIASHAGERGSVSYHDVAQTLKAVSEHRIPLQAAA